MKVLGLLIVIAIALIGSGGARAQGTLLLDDFLRQVEVNNPALRSADFEPELAEAEVRSALGRFDPVLNIEYDYKNKNGIDKENIFGGSLELPLDMLFGPRVKANYNRGIGSN
ncbi:MAG: TolC family protein, partial [Candidatus Kapabacteria bacterium]|nr:TolC family protein [Candidatus Kapabacteria bacterium]